MSLTSQEYQHEMVGYYRRVKMTTRMEGSYNP